MITGITNLSHPLTWAWDCHKATGLLTLGQLGGENSIPVKGAERVLSSYAAHGQDNEPLIQLATVLGSGRALVVILLSASLLYIVGAILGWSSKRACIPSHNAGGDLNAASGAVKNSGSPDRGNLWGDRGFVVAGRGNRPRIGPMGSSWKRPLKTELPAKGSRLFCSKVLEPTGLSKLLQLTSLNKANAQHVNTSVSRILADPEILLAAYSNIKSKPGNMSQGSDKQTLDGINLEWFQQTSAEIATGRFEFKPVRRINIPKPKGGTRPLGIASPRDKIVQEAMRMILEAIFSNQFSPYSHGFRPGRSCHTALNQVMLKFGHVNWFIEGDISKCFESFNHSVLIDAIKAKIVDQVFIDLIYKALRVGYIDTSGVFKSGKLGTPQGSIISPILCNIYLDKLDKWMEKLIAAFDKGKRRKQNPEYTKLTRGNSKRSPEDRRQRMRFIHENNIRQSLANDPGFKRLRYVRYADDILLGVIGSKADCTFLRDELAKFLQRELKLTLSLEKTKITHAITDRAFFLGTEIRMTPYGKKQIRRVQKGTDTRITKVSTRPQLLAPIDKIVAKLSHKKFCRHGLRGRPTRVGKFIHLNLDMIIHQYLTVARGLLNYYSFVDNYARLRARVLYILLYSCALTFASKLKLHTLKKVFTKFGPKLSIKDKDGKVISSFDCTLFPTSAPGFKSSQSDPFAIIDRVVAATQRTRKRMSTECSVCRSKHNLEMHHVRHLRKAGAAVKGDFLLAHMVRMNRKQIPLCSNCHHQVHRGLYDGRRLKSMG